MLRAGLPNSNRALVCEVRELLSFCDHDARSSAQGNGLIESRFGAMFGPARTNAENAPDAIQCTIRTILCSGGGTAPDARSGTRALFAFVPFVVPWYARPQMVLAWNPVCSRLLSMMMSKLPLGPWLIFFVVFSGIWVAWTVNLNLRILRACTACFDWFAFLTQWPLGA